ncbi:MAG: class I SAM-dependent methyltransferase [Verrucomicrobia bacterium]|nr:class I SAM-dependent methyltransferase [Verrucomicrobiota bacterium]
MDRLMTEAGDRFWHPEPFARDRWVEAQAGTVAAGSWVLDAGAGASKYRPFFKHCRYQTQDFCQYEGDLVKYLEPVDYVCDIASIPIETGRLDAILCTEVIEHVADPVFVLREFSRLLKRGGKLWLTSPLLSHLHMEPYHYYGGFTHYWYRHWLPLAGFVIESITPVGGPGTTCMIFNKAFYAQWGEAEKGLGFGKKVVSKCFRALAKIFVHYGFPWILPRFDRWLGSRVICSGYMVVARRL